MVWLTQKFEEYALWRNALSARIEQFRETLSHSGLMNEQIEERLKKLLHQLRQERLLVAFVAEFSRGKTELINAIFFSDYGSRILPSSAGRTTMCPTELFYDPKKPHGVELLPIQTRATPGNVSDYRLQKEAWTFIAVDIHSSQSMAEALNHVRETQKVSVEEAQRLGFDVGNGAEGAEGLFQIDDNGEVEIPRWRHALINFPHPLLRQGLVILNTPGLNAIGAEPELTLSLLPSAQVTLFVLAADAGVTQSDLSVWKEHICAQGSIKAGHIVVLNKIDSLWDELKTESEMEAEIAQQVKKCSAILDLSPSQIFTVSAHKGLVAKVKNDVHLLRKSRLNELERVLGNRLLPEQYDWMREYAENELNDIFKFIHNILQVRLDNLKEQKMELEELSGKNKGAVAYMLERVQAEQNNFEAGLKYYDALRKIFAQRNHQVLQSLNEESLRRLTQTTRKVMLSASFSKHLSGAMEWYFSQVLDVIWAAEEEIKEIHQMVSAAYQKFAKEYGLKLSLPMSFNLRHCEKEVERLHSWCDEHLNTTLSLLTQDKRKVTQRFFEEVTLRVRQVVGKNSRNCAVWLQSIIIPLEGQVNEHQLQLKRRLESISRIHLATQSLKERLNEVQVLYDETQKKIADLRKMSQRIESLFEYDATDYFLATA